MVNSVDILVADPAWWYNARKANTKFGSGSSGKYPQMKTPEICALPVKQVLAENALVFMWCTGPHLPSGFEVLASWGVRYACVAFVWVKTYKNAGTIVAGPGSYTGSNAEFVLLGAKGKYMEPAQHLVPQIIMAPRLEHSQKPEEMQNRIELMYPNAANKVELFATRQRPGWTCLGNKIDGVALEQSIVANPWEEWK